MRPTEDADLATLLRGVLDAAIELQGADFGDVQLLDSQTGTLRIVAHRGVGEEFLKHFACVDVNDTSACGTALKDGQRITIEDVTKYAPYSPHLAVAAKEKRADERLRQSEERLKAAVELAGLGLYSVEIDGGAPLLTWDNRVRSLWGLPADCEVTYDMWESAVHADDLERVRAAVAGAYDPSGDGVYDAEYRVIGADGVERWVATRAQAGFEHGRPVSLLGVVRDITDRKMIEHGLELVVDVRTSELIDASATLQAEREARQRTDERLELLQGELSRGLFAAIESRRVGLARPAERRVRDAAHKITQLSRRERQVLDGLVQGEAHKAIAHRLGISVRTVEIHRTRMLHRLGTPHLAEAIGLAVLAELAGE